MVSFYEDLLVIMSKYGKINIYNESAVRRHFGHNRDFNELKISIVLRYSTLTTLILFINYKKILFLLHICFISKKEFLTQILV